MKKKQSPNIILFLADDLGYGDISCLNPDSKIHTSNIDRLAAEGMKFTDAHATSAVCTPSRYGILTGRYNWRSRLKRTVLPGVAPHLIEDGRMTLASLLKSEGYHTAAVGKWHLGMDWATQEGIDLPYSYEALNRELPNMGIDFTKPVKNGPCAKGFDYFYGMPASLDQPPFVMMENERVLEIPDCNIGEKGFRHTEPGAFTKLEYGPAASGFDACQAVVDMNNKVLDLIDNYVQEDGPFFIYYPTPAVHGPLVPTEEYKGKSGIGLYGDFVLQMDGFVGQIMDKLKENNISENTILIFTSDNGCSTIVDIPSLVEKGHNPSYIFRGSKGDVWEGGHRIPLIIRWPEKIKANTTCDVETCLVDFFSTFADILGVDYPDSAGEDSVSNLPLWSGSQDSIREAIVHHTLFGYYSLRKNDWKLELCAGSGSNNHPMEGADSAGLPPMQLYNLRTDIRERINCFEEYPEVADELKRILIKYIKEGRSTPGEPQENFPCENWPGLEWMIYC